MHIRSVLFIALTSAGLLDAVSIGHIHAPHRRQDVEAQGRNNGGSATCLKADALQTAAASTGQEEGSEGIKAGQAPSAT